MRPQDITSVSWQCVTWPDGSKYAGEFFDNHMEGFGVYHWHDGSSFEGAWHQDKMHGCGIKFNTDDPGSMQQAGHFIDDEYVEISHVCSVAAAQQAAQQAMAAAHLASGLQEKEGAEGLQLRRHDPPEGRKPPSHASAFRNHSYTHTQSRTLQDAPNRKQLQPLPRC